MERLVTVPQEKVVPQTIERIVKCEVPVDRIIEVPVEKEVPSRTWCWGRAV